MPDEKKRTTIRLPQNVDDAIKAFCAANGDLAWNDAATLLIIRGLRAEGIEIAAAPPKGGA
jgi:hypothetical protein